MTFRLYLIKRNRNVQFLCSVRVPSVADAVRALGAYAARRQSGDKFAVRVAR